MKREDTVLFFSESIPVSQVAETLQTGRELRSSGARNSSLILAELITFEKRDDIAEILIFEDAPLHLYSKPCFHYFSKKFPFCGFRFKDPLYVLSFHRIYFSLEFKIFLSDF